MIEMVEIGAGGGSLARIDELERIQVGPESSVPRPDLPAMDKEEPSLPSPMRT